MEKAKKKIMVIVPHQDDEILLTAGIIADAVKNQDEVQVVMVTNGDYGSEDKTIGQSRLKETLAGLKVLGLKASAVTFLGYPDTGMPKEESFLYRVFSEKDPDKVYEGHCGSETYGLEEKTEFHMEEYKEHAPYTRKMVKQDLTAVIKRHRPDMIYTTSIEDVHGDHLGLALFLREILSGDQWERRPAVYEGLVHSKAGDDIWPLRSSRMECLTNPPYERAKGVLDWDKRIAFEVPEDMRKLPPEQNKKAIALSRHVTALKPDAVEFLYSFIKQDEIFWEWRTTEDGI